MSVFTQNQSQVDNFVHQEDWREQFLQKILIISALVGLAALISAIFTTTNLVLQSVYIGVYVLLVASILINFPYRVKATLFVSLPLILGISSLTETSIRGDALFFLLSFVTFSTLLIGPRSGIVSVIITEFIIGVMGYLILSDVVSPSDKNTFAGTLTD